jgi:hypothetical protein
VVARKSGRAAWAGAGEKAGASRKHARLRAGMRFREIRACTPSSSRRSLGHRIIIIGRFSAENLKRSSEGCGSLSRDSSKLIVDCLRLCADAALTL